MLERCTTERGNSGKRHQRVRTVIEQFETPDVLQILADSPPLFWIVCLRNMPADEGRDKVEKILFESNGEQRWISDGQIRRELSEEVTHNPAFAEAIHRQYRALHHQHLYTQSIKENEYA